MVQSQPFPRQLLVLPFLSSVIGWKSFCSDTLEIKIIKISKIYIPEKLCVHSHIDEYVIIVDYQGNLFLME